MAKRIENGNGKPTHEEIAHRAKAIYEASGKAPGRDLENWLAAEAELINARKPIEHKPMAEVRPVYKELPKETARRP